MTEAPKVQKCRACGNPQLVPAADIGEQYLSSIFPENLEYRKTLKKYPMDMVLCKKNSEENCGLLQLGHDLDLSAMYVHYPYTSSSNSSMNGILQDVMRSGADLGHLKAGDIVLDIGCNDGTLLSFFKDSEYQLIGIDAAHNIKSVFSSPNFKFARGFFDRKTFESLSPKKAKLIFSVAMFYHLSDPVSFSRDAAACLDKDGVWIIQMAYLPSMLETNMYDNIVHEHAAYYGIETLQWVMKQAGLEIFDVTLNNVYGGSYRAFIKHSANSEFKTTARFEELLKKEKQSRLFDVETYRGFDKAIQKTKADLRNLLTQIKMEGKTVWVYGASTKGNTILQYADIGPDLITAAADSNPFKFGKYLIGSDIPIYDEARMHAAKPDYLLALPYSFVEGFMKREQALVQAGTKFIVPLPDVRVLGRA